MAMDFWFHIYARKSQNYPGSGLGFGNNFFAHNWHYQQKFFVCVLMVVQQTKHKKKKTKNQIKNSRKDKHFETELKNITKKLIFKKKEDLHGFTQKLSALCRNT